MWALIEKKLWAYPQHGIKMKGQMTVFCSIFFNY